MNDQNQQLLEQVITKRLQEATLVADKEINDVALHAVDRSVELLKAIHLTNLESAQVEVKREEVRLKELSLENEKFIKMEEFKLKDKELNLKETEIALRKKEGRMNVVMKTVEVVGIVLVAPAIDFVAKKAFAQMLCIFEENNTFTNMAGKSLSGLFKWRK